MAPVTASKLDFLLTLVFPTKNRPQFFLQKTLEYYADVGFNHRLMIYDASTGAALTHNQNLIQEISVGLNIDYRVSYDTGHLEAYYQLLERVSTPYLMWAGDDDLFVPTHLDSCVVFLVTHADCNLAFGTGIDIYGDYQPDGRANIRQTSRFLAWETLNNFSSQRLLDSSYPTLVIYTYLFHQTDPLRRIRPQCLQYFLNVNEWISHLCFETTANSLAYCKASKSDCQGYPMFDGAIAEGFLLYLIHVAVSIDLLDQTANWRAEAGHERLLHNAGVDAEPIPELEFDQTLGL